jgi:hypothetical protein
MIKRYAIVRNATSRSQAEAYLPSNYEVIHEGLWTRYPGEVDPHGPRDVNVFVIAGQDDHGWTLDGYVMPRYASGLIWAEEIDLSHPIMREVPA